MLSLSKSGGPRNHQEEGSEGNCKDRRQRRREGQCYRSRMSLNFLIEQRQEIHSEGKCVYIFSLQTASCFGRTLTVRTLVGGGLYFSLSEPRNQLFLPLVGRGLGSVKTTLTRCCHPGLWVLKESLKDARESEEM